MRRIAGIIIVCAAAAALLFVASGAERGREVRGPRDLRQLGVPRAGHGRPDRGRQRRFRRRARRHVPRRARSRRRLGRSRQGGGRDADRRSGVPGLPRGRLLPDLPPVAPGREVRGVRAHPAPGVRHLGPARAGGDPRWRARRGPAPPAAGAERQVGRHRPRQQHHGRAVSGSLPLDPQRPRGWTCGPGRRARRDHRALESGAARDERGPRRPWRARTTRWRASPRTPTRS